MPILHAVVLGLVQGATELLPVSSSGHLILARWALGWTAASDEVEKTFDVVVHLGTLVGVVVHLRHDVARVVRGLISDEPAAGGRRLGLLLVGATVPAALTGALLEGFIVDHLGTPTLVAIMLIAFSGVLLWADRATGHRPLLQLDGRSAAVIGVAQALALQPGVSRSGATIAAARAMGFERDAAARISFLLSIPLISGAAAYELVTLDLASVDSSLLGALVVGAVTAAVTATLAIGVLLAVVRRRSFLPFVAYRVALGVTVLVAVATGVR